MRLSFFKKNQAASQEELNEKFIAAINSNKPIEKILRTLDNGASINTKLNRDWLTVNKSCLTVYDGMPALLFSLYNNNSDLTKELLNKGADVNIANDAGLTPLMYAAQDNFMQNLAKNLIDHGANKNQTDNKGKTAKDYAEEKGLDEMAKLLSTYEANPPTKQKQTIIKQEMGLANIEF